MKVREAKEKGYQDLRRCERPKKRAIRTPEGARGKKKGLPGPPKVREAKEKGCRDP